METRNRADALVHATEKSLKDLGDKVAGGRPCHASNPRCRTCKAVLKGDDKEAIDKKAEALAEAAATVAQQAYAQPGGTRSRCRAAAVARPAAQAGGKDDVVDAEFEEVTRTRTARAEAQSGPRARRVWL